MKTDNITIEISKLNEIIQNEINKIITLIQNNEILELNNYKFNITEIENYIEQDTNKKKRPINPINFCLARKPNLEQCTRNKKNGYDFCANHQFNHPFGRIDEKYNNCNTNNQYIYKIKEKREKSNIIELSLKIIDNNEYFIDKKNYIYIIVNEESKIKYKCIGIFDNHKNKIEYINNN